MRISTFLRIATLLAMLAPISPLRAAFPTIALKTISSGELFGPTDITNAADGSGRLFVCEQHGLIRIIQGGMLLPTPFLDIRTKLVTLSASYDERGLLGMAFHPGYTNPISPGYRKFYVFYSAVSPNARGNPTAVTVSAVGMGNPCVVTTSVAHAQATGNWVTISGVIGGTFSPTINALYPVTFIDSTHFSVPVNCSDNTGVTGGSVARSNPVPVNCRSTISEFQVTANANVANPLSERVLLTFDKPQSNHDGGQLQFGPDGFLYFTVGDGGGANDTGLGHTGASNPNTLGNLGNGQDKTSLLGKMHRIDPLGSNGPGGQYGIPPTNPFAGAGGGVRQEIYAYGLRNVWRFSFDNGPGGTNRLFAADVGQNQVEEVDIIVNGGNYGWHAKEAAFTFDATLLNALLSGGSVRSDVGLVALPGGAVLIEPIAQYAHPGVTIGTPALSQLGISIAGGYVYRGSAIPALQGKYVFGDYSATGGASSGLPNGLFLGLEETSPGSGTFSPPTTLTVIGGNPIPARLYSFGRDEAGELYATMKTTPGPVQLDPVSGKPSGIIYKIVPGQVTASLTPAKDNTIYSENGSLSNGQGYLFAGETGNSENYARRRALLAFDVAGQLPAGASIQSAQLMLTINKTSSVPGNMALHRLTEDWGEGASDAGDPGGAGTTAATNDATWSERFFNGVPIMYWANAGGTYASPASATTFVPGTGNSTWTSSQMATDVQGWVTTPASNFGWLLKNSTEAFHAVSAVRIDSGETPFGAPPLLRVTYAGAPPLTRRETWLQQYFEVGHFVDDLADLEGDGIVNLFEYGYGFSPNAVSAPGLQITAQTVGPNTVFTITFRRDPRATDLTYTLEATSDLTNALSWSGVVQSAGGAAPFGDDFISEADAPSESPIKIVTAQEIVPSPAKRWVRLRIQRAP